MSIAAALGIQIWLQQSKSNENKKLRRRLEKLLYIELSEIEADIEESLAQIQEKVDNSVIRNQAYSKIRYNPPFFSQESYLSLMNSGEFKVMDQSLQLFIQKIYSQVKRHNEFLMHIILIRDQTTLHEKKGIDMLERYDQFMQDLDRKILSDIKSVKEVYRWDLS